MSVFCHRPQRSRHHVLPLLLASACNAMNAGAGTEYPAPAESSLGMGFDSISGQTRGRCVDESKQAPKRHAGASVTTSVIYASTVEALTHELGVSGGASFGIFGVGVELGLEAVQRDHQSRSRSYAIVEMSWTSSTSGLSDYRLTESAHDVLAKGERRFYEMCGDGFIAAQQSGGHFIGIIGLTGVTQDESERLSGSAGVSFLGFGARASTTDEARRFLDSHAAVYYVAQRGGNVGGPRSAAQLESIDALLQSADAFRSGIESGKDVVTGVIVRPYQVVSNRPRGADLLDLREQRRFLDALSMSYGELAKAKADAQRSAVAGCSGEKRGLPRLIDEYTVQLDEIESRAEDCMNDPGRRCSDRGLEFLDVGRHEKALQACRVAEKPRASRPTRARREPEQRCDRWEVTAMEINIAELNHAGRHWDSANDPPDVVGSLRRRDELLAPLRERSGYSRTERFELYVKPYERLVLTLADSDWGSEPIATVTIEVPAEIGDGKWRAVGESATVTMTATCLRKEALED